MNSKPVKMSDVERAKVRVEGVVQEGIIDGEIDGALSLAARSTRGSSRGALAGRLGLIGGVWEGGPRVGWMIIGGKVESVCRVPRSQSQYSRPRGIVMGPPVLHGRTQARFKDKTASDEP